MLLLIFNQLIGNRTLLLVLGALLSGKSTPFVLCCYLLVLLNSILGCPTILVLFEKNVKFLKLNSKTRMKGKTWKSLSQETC